MDINFVKISPTQNMTIFIKDKFPREQHKVIAEKIMDYSNVFAEQVGFIEEAENKEAVARLQMMGNEFCGNATMSLASYLVWKENKPEDTIENVVLEVSGSNELLVCQVEVKENYFRSQVKMPLPNKIETIDLNIGGRKYPFTKVSFEGIAHFIIEEQLVEESKEVFLEKFKISKDTEVAEEAFGVMFFDKAKNYITPYVYVKSTKTAVWERGCGSGSASIAAYYYDKEQTAKTFALGQPGGEIELMTVVDTLGKLQSIYIKGSVKIVAEGIAYLD